MGVVGEGGGGQNPVTISFMAQGESGVKMWGKGEGCGDFSFGGEGTRLIISGTVTVENRIIAGNGRWWKSWKPPPPLLAHRLPRLSFLLLPPPPYSGKPSSTLGNLPFPFSPAQPFGISLSRVFLCHPRNPDHFWRSLLGVP